ncbi:hypothetical protein RBH29_02200 [Herbivorax sp. ANBcel31]|uniref:hypothetical protein n=1 Tax=Herbivorax sp. ANBcel31 TaxID=3069754 RepID=UPI0027B310C6|nr:hypothetical protein [Herbivorax sp. ANBcel31]MDQ2085247.1 hypothetical protein [Herbivorax sp. ANBcel31]
MTDRELLELIATEVSGLKDEVGGLKDEVGGLKAGQQRLEDEVGGLKDDFGGLKAGQQRLEDEVGGLKDDFGGLKAGQQRLENVVTRIENNHGQKLEALFDGWKQNTQQLKKHSEILETIDSKLEKQEVEIKVIKGNKRSSV